MGNCKSINKVEHANKQHPVKKYITSPTNHVEKTFELALKYLNTVEVIKTTRTSKLFYKLTYPVILFWNRIFTPFTKEYNNLITELSEYTPEIQNYVEELFASEKKPINNFKLPIIVNEAQINEFISRTTFLHLRDFVLSQNFFETLLKKYPKLSNTIQIINANDSSVTCSDFSLFVNKLTKLKTLHLPMFVPEGTLIFTNPNVTELCLSATTQTKSGMVLPNVSDNYNFANLKKYSYQNVNFQDVHIIAINTQFPLLEELSLCEVNGFKLDEKKNNIYLSFDEIIKDNFKLYKNIKTLKLNKNKTKGLCLLSLGNTIQNIIMTNTQIHPIVWTKLNSLPNLKLVDFSGCKLLGLDGKEEYTGLSSAYPHYNMVMTTINSLKSRNVIVIF
jgi:hypothetical protein